MLYIYYIYIPAPGLPRVRFAIFSKGDVMTMMLIWWYLQHFSNHHLAILYKNVVNSTGLFFPSIFYWYLHVFLNERSRKGRFQDVWFFGEFAFRHSFRAKNSDFSLFSFVTDVQHFLLVFARLFELEDQKGAFLGFMFLAKIFVSAE